MNPLIYLPPQPYPNYVLLDYLEKNYGTKYFNKNYFVAQTGSFSYITGAYISSITGVFDYLFANNISGIENITGLNAFFENLTVNNFTGNNSFLTNLTFTEATGSNAYIASLVCQALSGSILNSEDNFLTNITSSCFTGSEAYIDVLVSETNEFTNTMFVNMEGDYLTVLDLTGSNAYVASFTGDNNFLTNTSIENLTGSNAYIASLTAENNFLNNVSVNNAYVASLTCDNFSGSNNLLDNLTVSNFSGSNVSISSFTGDNNFLTNTTFTNMTGSYLTLNTISGTNAYFSNISGIEDANFQDLTVSNFSGSNNFLNNLTVSNFSGSNVSVSNFSGSNNLLNNVSISNFSGSNNLLNNLTVSNFSGSNNLLNNLTVSNFSGSNVSVYNAYVESLTGGSVSANNAYVASLTCDSLTSDTFSGSNAYINSLIAGSVSATSLTGENGTFSNLLSADTIMTGNNIFISNSISGYNVYIGQNLSVGNSITGYDAFLGNNLTVGNSITGNFGTFQNLSVNNLTGNSITLQSLAVSSLSCNSGSFNTVYATGGMAIDGGLSNTSTRPPLQTTLASWNIRSFSGVSEEDDDGFLRISAGGGTDDNTQTAIDVSGYSTVSDMNTNIVFWCGGNQIVRINQLGVIMTGYISTSNNILDDGSGNMKVGNLTIDAIVSNPSLIFQTSGTNQMLFYYDNNGGISIYDLTNNCPWLNQLGKVAGSIYTKNNTLDDGSGNMTVANILTASSGSFNNAYVASLTCDNLFASSGTISTLSVSNLLVNGETITNLTVSNLTGENNFLDNVNISGNLTGSNAYITSLECSSLSGSNSYFSNISGNVIYANTYLGDDISFENLSVVNFTGSNNFLDNVNISGVLTGHNGIFSNITGLTYLNFEFMTGYIGSLNVLNVNDITGYQGTLGYLNVSNMTGYQGTLDILNVNNMTGYNGTFSNLLTVSNMTGYSLNLGQNLTVNGNNIMTGYSLNLGQNLTVNGNITGSNAYISTIDCNSISGNNITFQSLAVSSLSCNSGSFNTVYATGGMAIDGGLSNTSTRPPLQTTLASWNIRSFSGVSEEDDDGFLRISAGGGTDDNTQTAIDVSGYSTVSDMNTNIVFWCGGNQIVRINQLGVSMTGYISTSNNILDDGSGNAYISKELTTAHNTLDDGSGNTYISNEFTINSFLVAYPSTNTLSFPLYSNIQLNGGNSIGAIWGDYNITGYMDSINIGYNFFPSSGGSTSTVIPNIGGGTSIISCGFDNISLQCGGVNTAPSTVLSINHGGVNLGYQNPNQPQFVIYDCPTTGTNNIVFSVIPSTGKVATLNNILNDGAGNMVVSNLLTASSGSFTNLDSNNAYVASLTCDNLIVGNETVSSLSVSSITGNTGTFASLNFQSISGNSAYIWGIESSMFFANTGEFNQLLYAEATGNFLGVGNLTGNTGSFNYLNFNEATGSTLSVASLTGNTGYFNSLNIGDETITNLTFTNGTGDYLTITGSLTGNNGYFENVVIQNSTGGDNFKILESGGTNIFDVNSNSGSVSTKYNTLDEGNGTSYFDNEMTVYSFVCNNNASIELLNVETTGSFVSIKTENITGNNAYFNFLSVYIPSSQFIIVGANTDSFSQEVGNAQFDSITVILPDVYSPNKMPSGIMTYSTSTGQFTNNYSTTLYFRVYYSLFNYQSGGANSNYCLQTYVSTTGSILRYASCANFVNFDYDNYGCNSSSGIVPVASGDTLSVIAFILNLNNPIYIGNATLFNNLACSITVELVSN